MKQYNIILFCIFFMLAFGVNAQSTVTNYHKVGFSQDDSFSLGRGVFNEELDPNTDVDKTIKALTASKLTPLVADFDNDTVNEITVIDEDTIRMYNGIDLDVVASYDYGTDQYIGNMIAFDIDGDNILELIVAFEDDRKIRVFNYSSGTISLQAEITTQNSADGELLIGCRDVNQCLYVAGERYASTTGAINFLQAQGFNSTNVQGTLRLVEDTSGAGQEQVCLSRIRSMAIADFDQDGQDEFIFTGYHASASGSVQESQIYYMNLSASGQADQEDINPVQVVDNAIFKFSTSSSCTTSGMDSYISPPLVFDGSGDYTGLETYVAYNKNADEFELQGFRSDGSSPNALEFPFLTDVEGELISNVFQATAFPASGGTDVCAVGYNQDEAELRLICGGSNTDELFQSNEYSWPITDSFNVTDAYQNYHIVVHGVQHSNDLTDGVDLSEMISSHGVFRLDKDSCILGVSCDMERIFNPSSGSAVILSGDYEGFGFDDLVAMTDTQLIYYDDGQTNRPGYLSSVVVNPCITNSIVKQNTTIKLTVEVGDGNAKELGYDTVSSRATIYYNSPNALESVVNNTTVDSSTGLTTHTHSFIANATGAAVLYLEAWDTVNPTTIDTQSIAFNVQSDGVEFGDCSATLDFVQVVVVNDTGANESLTPAQTNLVKSSVVEINSFFHIGLTAVWLLIIVIIDIFLIANSQAYFKQWGSNYLFTLIAIIDVVMILLGAIFLIVPVWVIMLLIVSAVGVGVVFLVNKFQGQGV